MVRASGNVFGFDKVEEVFRKLTDNVVSAEDTVRDTADVMRDDARKYFGSKTTTRTGQGKSGIQSEHTKGESTVGWGARPGFHPFFFEHGFVAKDNRNKRIPIRKRRGTWIPARPHMRPAFYDNIDEYKETMKTKLHKI